MRKVLFVLALLTASFSFAQNDGYDNITGIQWERDSVYLWCNDSTYTFPVSTSDFKVTLDVTDTRGSVAITNKSDKPVEIDWSRFQYRVNDMWDVTAIDYAGGKTEKVYKNARTNHAFYRSFGAKTTKLLNVSSLEKIRKKRGSRDFLCQSELNLV